MHVSFLHKLATIYFACLKIVNNNNNNNNKTTGKKKENKN
jgi:hypothetical protein